MRRSSWVLALVAALWLAACGGRSAGVLGADTGGGGKQDGSSTGGPDGSTTPRDTGGGSTDDIPPHPACESGTKTLSELQQDDIGLQCDPSVPFLDYPSTETFCGLIVVSPRFTVDENLYAYFVAEAAGPWHGAQLVVPADMDGDYGTGTVLEVLAEPQEFYCLTQVKALQAPKVLGTSALPAAEEVSPGSLAPDGTGGEPYEGVLVTVKDVHVGSTASWGFVLTEGLVEVSDGLELGIRPSRGCAITSVTGVVSYSFERYQIIPLSADAVVYDPQTDCPAGLQSVTEVQSAAASAACDTFDEQSAVYPEGGGDLVWEGLVVTTPRVHVSSNLKGYYVQDPAAPAPEWSGVLVRFFEGDDPQLLMGDVVTVRGDWQEFHCLTQIAVEFPDGGPPGLEKTTASVVPDPVPVDGDRLGSEPAFAEQYEGVLVQVGAQTVTELPAEVNHWQVTFASGLKMEDLVSYHYEDYLFTEGQEIPGIIGVVAGDTYNEGVYFLLPRGAADIGVTK